jgi:hypothetical protein
LTPQRPSASTPTLTNKDMEKIRAIRESTCIHGCYYVDDPKECIPPEENGIPNCKREIELIIKALASREQDRVAAKTLNERLDAFRKEMFEKFLAVEHKHRGNSVTDDSVNWLHFDWSQIEAHFWEEIDEVKGAMRHGSSETQTKELVDVANMAFLLWWKEKQFIKSVADTTKGTATGASPQGAEG